jgi:branched-chain amino acid transport system substrate-binding protein
MRQAANLKDFHAPFLYPAIVVNTSPTNYTPVHQLQRLRRSQAIIGSLSGT